MIAARDGHDGPGALGAALQDRVLEEYRLARGQGPSSREPWGAAGAARGGAQHRCAVCDVCLLVLVLR